MSVQIKGKMEETFRTLSSQLKFFIFCKRGVHLYVDGGASARRAGGKPMMAGALC